MKYTVIGFWLDDVPLAAGTVEGHVTIWGGSSLDDNSENDLKGGWSQFVQAPDAVAAEELAVAGMESTLNRGINEEDEGSE